MLCSARSIELQNRTLFCTDKCFKTARSGAGLHGPPIAGSARPVVMPLSASLYRGSERCGTDDDPCVAEILAAQGQSVKFPSVL